jgi:hypothetical protein
MLSFLSEKIPVSTDIRSVVMEAETIGINGLDRGLDMCTTSRWKPWQLRYLRSQAVDDGRFFIERQAVVEKTAIVRETPLKI